MADRTTRFACWTRQPSEDGAFDAYPERTDIVSAENTFMVNGLDDWSVFLGDTPIVRVWEDCGAVFFRNVGTGKAFTGDDSIANGCYHGIDLTKEFVNFIQTVNTEESTYYLEEKYAYPPSKSVVICTESESKTNLSMVFDRAKRCVLESVSMTQRDEHSYVVNIRVGMADGTLLKTSYETGSSSTWVDNGSSSERKPIDYERSSEDEQADSYESAELEFTMVFANGTFSIEKGSARWNDSLNGAKTTVTDVLSDFEKPSFRAKKRKTTWTRTVSVSGTPSVSVKQEET